MAESRPLLPEVTSVTSFDKADKARHGKMVELRLRGTLPVFQSDVKARHDKMVELVERMLDPSAGSGQALHKQLPGDR